jgi:hypothetical protein
MIKNRGREDTTFFFFSSNKIFHIFNKKLNNRSEKDSIYFHWICSTKSSNLRVRVRGGWGEGEVGDIERQALARFETDCCAWITIGVVVCCDVGCCFFFFDRFFVVVILTSDGLDCEDDWSVVNG